MRNVINNKYLLIFDSFYLCTISCISGCAAFYTIENQLTSRNRNCILTTNHRIKKFRTLHRILPMPLRQKFGSNYHPVACKSAERYYMFNNNCIGNRVSNKSHNYVTHLNVSNFIRHVIPEHETFWSFQWGTNMPFIKSFQLLNHPKTYVLKGDLKYLKHIHDLLSDYLLVPKNCK